MKKVSIIGCGNMGGAIARGLATLHADAKNWLYLCDTSEQKLSSFKKEFSLSGSSDLARAVKDAHIIVLALKPLALLDALKAVISGFSNNPLLISVAAGIKIEQMKAVLGDSVRYARAMPNLPCLIGQGISGIYAEEEDLNQVRGIFSAIGDSLVVKQESDLDTVTGLSGCGPAFTFYMIDALARGGIEKGLGEKDALLLATQTVLGAAELLKQSPHSPQELIAQVATPGGSTLAGLRILEERKAAEAFSQAVVAATKRAKEQGEKK